MGVKHGDRTTISVRALYDRMIDRFVEPEEDNPWLMPSICIFNFLVFADRWNRDGYFFDLLHEIMEEFCRPKRWEFVWKLFDREEMFVRFVNCKRARLIKVSKLAW